MAVRERDYEKEQTERFLRQVNMRIAVHGGPKVAQRQAFEDRQKETLETLIATETAARQALIRHPQGLEAYNRFIALIQDERGQLSSAQPCFREPETVFGEHIGIAIRARDARALFEWHVNYPFFFWLINNSGLTWAPDDEVVALYKIIVQKRKELMELNLPLAINRAKGFFRRTPESHLSLSDLIHLAVEGLAVAIDKFRLPYRRVFLSVAIGRMTANFLAQYNQTTVRFSPLDKKRLYRANKALRFAGGTFQTDDGEKETAVEHLLRKVNEKETEKHSVQEQDLRCLMRAASVWSLDWQRTGASSDSDEYGAATLGELVEAPTDTRPDAIFEAKAQRTELAAALAGMSVLERKVLALTYGLDWEIA